MRLAACSIALVSALSLSLPSLAATVDSVQGQVSINRGDGFQPVTGAAQANVGDSVMVSPGGKARVVYSDGCPVNVNPGAVVTISAESPCTAFAQASPDQTDYTPYVVGGVLVAGGVGAVILLTQKNDDRPASP